MIAASKLGNGAIQHTHMCVFLGAFAKLRKVTVSSCLFACPSARNNSAPNRRIFVKCYILVFFENLSTQLKFY
jgi:hypothetical protein